METTHCEIRTLPNSGHGAAESRVHLVAFQGEDSNSVTQKSVPFLECPRLERRDPRGDQSNLWLPRQPSHIALGRIHHLSLSERCSPVGAKLSKWNIG